MTREDDTSAVAGFGLEVDRNAEVPIGVQLAWALRARISDGSFKPGQRIPGLRELADATGVNVNTVRVVYQRLDQEGLIDTQKGRGTFVGPAVRKPSDLATLVANTKREARETGVSPRELASALYVSSEEPGVRDVAAERRLTLRRQLAALERTLGEIEADHPGIAPPVGAPRRTRGPALLSVEELEQSRTWLVRRLAIVQAAIDAHEHSRDEERQPAKRRASKRDALVPGERRETSARVRAPRTRATGTGRASPGASPA